MNFNQTIERNGPHVVDLRDLDFQRVPIQRYGTQGTPYIKWVKVGMPKINQEILHAVFFLYRNADDARDGVNSQGTGFIVADNDGRSFYGVSNKHVAISVAPVVRINTHDGAEIFDFGPEDWESHPDGDDIAAIELAIDPSKHSVSAIPARLFSHKDNLDLGVGDDVFMVGLFANHEGKEKNNPLARFGNISMLAHESALVPWDGKLFHRHIVDMHSRGGYSGSPVFVYRTFGADLKDRTEYVRMDLSPVAGYLEDDFRHSSQPVRIKVFPETMFYLLGMQCAQFMEPWKLKGAVTIEDQATLRTSDATYLSGSSGMSSVVPAWKILEILNIPKFVARREASLAAVLAARGRRTEPEIDATDGAIR